MFALHAKSYWNHADNRNGGWERRRPRLVRKISDTNDAGENACAPSSSGPYVRTSITSLRTTFLDRQRRFRQQIT